MCLRAELASPRRARRARGTRRRRTRSGRRASPPSGSRRLDTASWPDRVPRPAGRRDGDGRAACCAPGLERARTLARALRLLATRLHVLRPRSRGSTRARRATRRSPSARASRRTPRRASGSCGSSERCTSAGPTAVGCGARRERGERRVVLEVSGLGAYTLLKGESGCTCWSSRRARAAVRPRHRARRGGRAPGRRKDGATAASRRIVRRYRHEPSPLVRNTTGMRTGRIDRVLAGDFDLR